MPKQRENCTPSRKKYQNRTRNFHLFDVNKQLFHKFQANIFLAKKSHGSFRLQGKFPRYLKHN